MSETLRTLPERVLGTPDGSKSTTGAAAARHILTWRSDTRCTRLLGVHTMSHQQQQRHAAPPPPNRTAPARFDDILSRHYGDGDDVETTLDVGGVTYAPQRAQTGVVMSPVSQRQTFVAPARQPAQVRLPDVMQDGILQVPTPAQSLVELRSNYTDRSRGFVMAITPVAVVTGILAMLAALTLWSVPFFSWTILQVFAGMFCATWTIGYALHLAASPDGVLFATAWWQWQIIRREQRHRHRRYWQAYRDGQDGHR